jgi:hypothetical protein
LTSITPGTRTTLVDDVERANLQQRVTISRSADDNLGPDGSASTRPIFDDERLPQSFRQPLSQEPCDDVAAAASGKWDDDAHRPRRIGLRPCDARHHRQRGGTRRQMQKSPTRKVHGISPVSDQAA